MGEVRFAEIAERDASSMRLTDMGLVVVELEGVGPSARGRLGEVIDQGIEDALAARGAAAPGITSGSDRDATLSDQLFRTRRVGCTGLGIILGPLRAAAGPRAALEPEDCATLRFLAEATAERPLVLILDARDSITGAYGDPVSLRSLLIPTAPGLALSLGDSRLAPACQPDRLTDASTTQPLEAAIAVTLPAPPLARDPGARHTAGAAVVEKEERWRAWTLQLTKARGPQPLTVLEKLFIESYMPLANAITEGLDDAKAVHARSEFAATFAKGYSDAFPTFSATSKRPRMVLDAHETASRMARLHGARSTRVLVVDAMRWDVARLIEERVVARLGGRASLAEEMLLWSALPTTSLRQLETIARGVDALRAPATLDAEPEPPRGRNAEYPRRMRVGPREIHKLDVVESRVQAAHGTVLRELPAIADAAADAIARHAETCPPRTLLLVTGDHGFTIDRHGSAQQGGASPEEVLVGAFALLVGDVH